MSLSSYITSLLVLLIVVGGWYVLDRYEEDVVVDILAPREEELGLPIYAQFVATQSLTLDRRTTVTRLVVPVYFPGNQGELQFDLLAGGKLVQRWRVNAPAAGIVEVDLVLEPPYVLEGVVELQFSAPDITHDEAEVAPRLFVEKADQQYPGGNYRIAANEKEGDISLKVIERRRVLDQWLAVKDKRPLKVLGQVGLALMLIMLILSLPRVLERVVLSSKSR